MFMCREFQQMRNRVIVYRARLLSQAAVAAVRRWQFSPAMQESRTVTAWTQVNVVFQLNR